MAHQIRAFLDEPRVDAAVHAVLERMETLTVPEGAQISGPLQGERYVFTGTLASMPRSRAKEIVEGAGGRVSSSLSTETDFLVQGAGGGSKAARAAELGVEILTEQEVLDRLEALGIGS
jgi:DNA ligase (NAD+)